MSIKFITIITIFLLLLGLVCSNSTATELILEPSTQFVTTGESFTVDVFVTPDTAIAGLQFDLEFDSSKIQIDNVNEGVFLSQNGVSTFFSSGNIDNNAGTLSGVFGSVIGPSSVLGPESFASITMSVNEQATSTSTVFLKNVIISDPSGDPIDVQITDLTLTINEVPVAVANAPSECNKGDLLSFNALGSYDPDGVALISYEWDFGDGTTASGSEVTHVYANNGIYMVTLTVTDNEGTSASDTIMVTVNNVATFNTISIDSTTMSVVENHKFWKWTRVYATAEIKIVDATGNPVNGATVSGQWSDTTTDSDSGVTDSNGKVTVESKSVWGSEPRTFIFTVNGVSHAIQWDGETKSGTITYQ